MWSGGVADPPRSGRTEEHPNSSRAPRFGLVAERVLTFLEATQNEHSILAGWSQGKLMAVAARAAHWTRRPSAREGGSHAENTRGLTLLLVQPRIGPDRAGADRQPQKQRECDHLRRGLSPKPIQPAQSDQQIERQAPRAG